MADSRSATLQKAARRMAFSVRLYKQGFDARARVRSALQGYIRDLGIHIRHDTITTANLQEVE